MVKYLFNSLNDLNAFKDEDAVVITDIDGTISEIGSVPSHAKITSEMRNVLLALANKHRHVGVLTGREINDAFNIIKLKKLVYMGNHGLERFKNGKLVVDSRVKSYIPVINDINKFLHEKLELSEGFSFDYKTLSLTVHYNSCEDKIRAKKKILDLISTTSLGKLVKVVEGRDLLEIRPPVGHDKGTILQKFISENNIKKIIYLGDDINDVCAFEKLEELNQQHKIVGVSVAVNSNETPNYVKEAANFYVDNVQETYKFLNWLCGQHGSHYN